MTMYRGLTWDHPRGRQALKAASLRFEDEGDTLTWSAHSLEGFESHPIQELAEAYDLIVLDHPHLGDARAADCLRPLDELFGADEIAAWSAEFVGPSFSSYVMDGHAWALPLDAATQVSARRADLLADAPRDWAEAVNIAREAPVAMSLSGPHAFLTWCSVLVGEGAAPAEDDDAFCDPEAGASAIELMRQLAALTAPGSHELNPISLLERMTSTDELAYIPLVYGYSSYANPHRPRRVAFATPPAGTHGAGSTIGGTGLAVSRRCNPSPGLLDHLRWLVSEAAQTEFIPRNAGQPGLRAAWLDDEVDRASGGFYSGTLSTISSSWVRPRFAGYIPFQSWASEVVRSAVLGEASAIEAWRRIDDRYTTLLRETRGTR